MWKFYRMLFIISESLIKKWKTRNCILCSVEINLVHSRSYLNYFSRLNRLLFLAVSFTTYLFWSLEQYMKILALETLPSNINELTKFSYEYCNTNPGLKLGQSIESRRHVPSDPKSIVQIDERNWSVITGFAGRSMKNWRQN